MCPSLELKKQLEEQRFLHAEAYVRSSAGTLKQLTASELGQLNHMLTGDDSDPWRMESVSVAIPSGNVHHFNILTNPLIQAREVIGHALDLASAGEVSPAAFYLYSRLVLNHFFRDANRRTAVLATLWLLKSVGRDIAAGDLVRLGVGDLRNPIDAEILRRHLSELIQGRGSDLEL